MLSGDYRKCKLCEAPALTKYKLKYDEQKVDLLECTKCKFHFLDYLDPPFPSVAEDVTLSYDEIAYISEGLQSSAERFDWQVNVVSSSLNSTAGARILDIGAGGGKFLSSMRERGALTFGIEPNATRVAFARQSYGLELRPELVGDPYWQDNPERAGTFDVVCLWDVIEHVNSPVEVLKGAIAMLKPGGKIFIDTPTRKALFYRLGALSYNLTGGRVPFLLKTMYSPTIFAHKQIFTEKQLAKTLTDLGMRMETLETFNELSFPKTFYLQRLFKSERLAKIATPFAEFFLRKVPVRNKILAIAALEDTADTTGEQ